MDHILLRYGEIGIKSEKKRRIFEKFYVQAIDDALKRNGILHARIINRGKRFFVEGPVAEMISVLKRVPGIQSFSPAKKVIVSSKDQLIKDSGLIASPWVKGKKFAVECKRIGSHDFNSHELQVQIGSELYSLSAGVDLTHPEVTVHVEIREKEAYIFTKIIPGLGGLPPKTSGKFLCLFSGGIDSPVAAYHLLKRGCQVDFLFINLVGESAVPAVAGIYNFVSNQFSFGYTPRLIVIDGTKIVNKIKAEVDDRLRQIALKINFYRIAEQQAKKGGYDAIATGEALSQKSTQTIEALSLLDKQVTISVLRPLLVADKLEIIKTAHEIGTFASSQKIKEICNISEGPVVTAPDERIFTHLPNFDDFLAEAEKSAKVYKGQVSLEESLSSDENIDLPVITVDMRSASLQRAVPLNADLKFPFPDVMEHLNEFDSSKQYMLICEFGVRSQEVAYLLEKKKVKAQSMSINSFLKSQRRN